MINQFIPHGHCYLWKSNLVGLHLISDLLIAVSYYSIPITIIYFVRQRKDLPYASTFILFGAFIVSCGTSHLLEIWTLWHPAYWISGVVKAITALISCYTAMEMLTVVQRAIALPSAAQLKLANQKLEQEILERKHIEAELEQERGFITAMLDNLSDGIVACDRHGVLSMFNRATQEFHGLAQQAIAPELWSQHYDLYLPDGKTKMTHEEIPLFRAFKGESVRDVEMAIVPKQGKPRNLIVSADPIIDGNGEKLGAIAIMRDVTEARQAQLALQIRESAIKSFYDSAPLMMGIVELIDRQDLSHVSGNSMVAAAFGLSPEAIAGKQVSELNIPQKIKRRLVDTCLQSEARLEPVELEFTCKVGEIDKDFLAIISIVAPNYLSEFSLFSYMIQDISDRKRMETRIRESELRFRLAFEDAATGMALVATDGLFLEVNRSLCEIVGFSQEELIELNFQQITHCDDLENDLEYMRQLLAGEIRSSQFQKRYIHKQGHTIWIHLSVSLVRDIKDRPQYFIAQIQDITEGKTAEIKLNKSVRDKEVMLQEIHHRVKNNLQVICSLLNLQSRYLKDKKTLKAFKETQNRVKSMALVHEHLYQSTNLSEIVLSDYVKQLTANLLRTYAINSDIKYHLDIEDFNLDLDTAVPCGLIINELITNAIKYAFDSVENSEISIKAVADESKRLVLTISDNGIGLDSNYELETSKSLGLRLVKSLTEQLQGKHEIITGENLGTKFEFTFDRIKQ